MAAKLARLTETWSLDLNKERAQTTLWWLSPSGQSIASLEAALASAVNTRWDNTRGVFSTKTTWLSGRVDEINITTGNVVAGIDLVPVTNAGGNGSANTLPCEVAEVLTLRTPFSGPSYRGRIYLPPVHISSMTADGQIVSATTVQLVDAYAAFFADINGGGTDYESVIYSRKLRAATPTDSCDMGDVFDVMRSRRRSLVEVRYSAGF